MAGASSRHAKLEVATTRLQGELLTVGLRFIMDKQWYILWKNPGDHGRAPQFKWDIAGLKPTTLHWPAPSRLGINTATSYGMKDTVYFLQEMEMIGKEKTLIGELQATWQECKQECLEASVRIPLQWKIKPGIVRPGYNWKKIAVKQQPKHLVKQVRGVLDSHLILELGHLSPAPDSVYFFAESPLWNAKNFQELKHKDDRWLLYINMPAPDIIAEIDEFSGVLQIVQASKIRHYLVPIPLEKSSKYSKLKAISGE